MADCKKYSKKKNYLNHNSKNGLLLLIYIMALIFESHGTALGTDDDENCSDAWTCTKCTIKAQCAWSLGYQKCVDNTRVYSNFTIYSEEKCPRFSVVTKQEYKDELINLQYIVKVSNDEVGFMNYLKESMFYCNSTTIADVHTKMIKNDEIICSATIPLIYFKQISMQSFTAFIYIKFKYGTLLQLDNVADHYVTFYEHECAEHKKDENCATCTWNDYSFAFVRLCSSGNTCEGHKEFYLWHYANGKPWNSNTRKVKNQCAEINVTSVDPLSGPLAGGTTITITVKNHLIFEENRKVMVTVAGMVCADPRTSGPETITCVTTPPTDDTIYIAPFGPVLVKYKSHKRELIIESSQKFYYYVDITSGASRLVINLYTIMIHFSFFVFYTKMV